MNINEQWIMLQAPNPAAAANGRSLSRSGAFSGHGRTEDGQLYWADCTGSGSHPYQVSVDFAENADAPTCRCSCPSRQFPCKHALGLLFELAAEKPFAIAPIPDALRAKRERVQARKESATEAKPEAKPKRTNLAAQKKKITRQLEGLDLADRLVDDLLNAGIATLAGSSAQTYENAAKELGSCYLTGPQIAFRRIALAVQQIEAEPAAAERHYAEALRVLISLRSTLKKARTYLAEKLTAETGTDHDTSLFEALGGIWQLEDLHAIGAYREHARLVQLAFDVTPDEAKKEYAERGFWIDLDTGAIDRTMNLRPLKALKYVKAEDSCFDLLEIPTLYLYPGEMNRRIRWEGCSTRPITADDLAAIRAHASPDIPTAVKIAKGQFKNTLLPKWLPVLLPTAAIGCVGDELVLVDPSGNRICLRDDPQGAVKTLLNLPMVPEPVGGDALFGLLFYDESDRSICFCPYSYVGREQIIRLLY